MTSVSPATTQTAQVPPRTAEIFGATCPLPEPTVAAYEPQDALAMMLTAMEQLSQSSLAHTERRLQHAQDKLDQRLDEFLDNVKKALEAARRAAQEEEDDGGLFSDIVDAVSEVAGEVLGTIVDFAKDAVEQPFEVAIGAAKNIDEPGAMLQVMKDQLIELAQNGDTAESVKGFTKGVLKFEAKLIEFAANLQLALLKNGGDFEGAWRSVEGEAKELWKSFRQNILENPSFWEVTGALAKIAAVGAAVMSGGTLAWIAVGMFVLCEADQRTGFVQKVVGDEKATQWTRLIMQGATAALLGFAAAGGEASTALKWIQAGGAMLGGTKQIYDGVRMLEEGERQADELRHTANVQEALARMQQMQRVIDGLLELLTEQSENRRAKLELGAGLVQTRADAEAATIVRA